MSKNEFMEALKEALSGSVPSNVYYDTVSYYESYFHKEMAAGKSEETVVKELGSARLIAKTIIETQGSIPGAGMYEEYEDRTGSRRKNRQGRQREDDEPKGWHIKVDDYGNTSLCFGRLDFSTVTGKIVIGIALFVLICLVVFVLYIGIKALIYVVIPLAVILFIVNFIFSIINNNRT